jgi:hypothetical protein
MFGSNLLEVAIGLVFVFLLISLVCSAANEIIECWLKNRSTDLERGIRELFGLNPNEKKPAMMAALYDNPMINGLFKGKYADEAKGTWQRARSFVLQDLLRKGPRLPSYIPARTFALALMDIATAKGATGVPATAETASPGSVPTWGNSGATGSTPGTLPSNVRVTLTAIPPAPPAPGQPGNRLTELRNAVIANPILPEQLRAGLLTLIDAAGSDVAKARENIETWFNGGMERVSGWYKRRTQIIILFLGFGIAGVFNVDTIIMAHRLSTDKSLRESLVAAAGDYAKANAETPAASASPAPSGSTAGTAASSSATGGTATGGAATPGVPAPSPSTAAAAPPVAQQSQPGNLPATPSVTRAAQAFEENYDRLEHLGLPIGWDTDESRTLVARGIWLNKRAWTRKLLGWIITALAVSLGAPFWFDMLNKLVIVRSTIKPQGK